MKPIDLAQKHLGQFRTKGNELVPIYCPFCQGGEHHDKYTFALHRDTGAYNCKRGSCGATGSFQQLSEHFGESSGREYELYKPAPPRTYKPPTAKLATPAPTSKVGEYLRTRGFSDLTWQKRGIKEVDGNIAMPYYEGGNLVLVKYRPARKVKDGERKAWREKDGKPVFWGMDECDPKLPLVIVEGEMDALTLDEAGVPNVVSVPSGAEDLTCVDLCWDWLEQFKRVIIWPDADMPGREMARKLVARLGAWRCAIVQTTYKDANLVLYHKGKEAVAELVAAAVEVPISGLIRLADVKAFDHEEIVRVKSSLPAINRIVGGYMVGQVSVWTGNSGAGKSTLLGQELLAAIDQGYRVCAYSGELPGALFRYWIDLQAAGPSHLYSRADRLRGTEDGQQAVVWYPRTEIVGRIRDWYRDSFFLHDAFGCTTDEALLEVFTYAARRYDCKVFLIDNLMTTAFGGTERDFYRKQSEFVGRMMDFAHEHEVHVHLVAHPRKTEGRLSKLDVSGSGDITNRADNVFSVWRTPASERAGGVDETSVTVLKNRFGGRQDEEVVLAFEGKSKRFFQAGEGTAMWAYGWADEDDNPQGWDAMGAEVAHESPF